MSQNSLTLPTTGTVSGLSMTQATNNALDTLNTLASGATAPASPEAGQLWHDTTNNLLKLRSLDNTTWIPFLQLNESAYAAAASITPTGTNDRMNRVINGGMMIDQVNEGSSYSILVNNTPAYTVDQGVVSCDSTVGSPAAGVTAQRVTDAPANFTNSLKITVGTGAASVGATDFLYYFQPIEANNLSDLNFGTSSALPVSLSFWVKSSVAGTFAAVLYNPTGNRSIVNKFTVASTGTWQQVTIPNIPGDQSGTYATGASLMINLTIVIATGTTDQTSTLNSWQTGTWLGSTSQTNTVLTTSGATFQITGVQFNSGAFCQSYEKRQYQQELALCERYFEKLFAQGVAVAQDVASGLLYVTLPTGASGEFSVSPVFRTPKRASPTIVTYNPFNTNANWRDTTNSADRTASVTNTTDKATTILGSGGVAGSFNNITFTANARM
jgi:hypothetical protein